jgi:hypothetical protein
LRGGDIKYLPEGAFVKAIKKEYLPKDFDIPCSHPEEVAVYSQFGLGVVSRREVSGLDD